MDVKTFTDMWEKYLCDAPVFIDKLVLYFTGLATPDVLALDTWLKQNKQGYDSQDISLLDFVEKTYGSTAAYFLKITV